MATTAPGNTDTPCIARLPSGNTEHQQEEQEPQQPTRLSTESRAETNTSAPTKGDDYEASVVAQASQALPGISKMQDDAEQRQQGEPGGASVACAGLKTEGDENRKEKQEEDEEQQNNNRSETAVSHGREQVLLWSVRKGLTPIAAAAVEGCSRGEVVLETPSSAAATPATKEAAPLEDETPRTSVPSSEVSPTNNFCSYRSFASAYASSTSTASHSSSWSALSTSGITGAIDTDENDNRAFFPAALESPPEILTVAGAATGGVSSVGVPAAGVAGDTAKGPAESTDVTHTTIQDLRGESAVAGITPEASADAAEDTASDNSSAAAAASEVLTATAAADAAAILSSPAALSLLATPCPVGGPATGAFACSTGTEAAAEPDSAAERIATDQGLVDALVGAAGTTRAESAAVGATTNVGEAMGEEANADAAAANAKNTYLKHFGSTDAEGTLRKEAPQEQLKAVTASEMHEEQHKGPVQEKGTSDEADQGRVPVESSSSDKGRSRAPFAEVGDPSRSMLLTLKTESVTAMENKPDAAAENGTSDMANNDATTAAGAAAVTEGLEGDAAGSPPPLPRGKAPGDVERRGGSLLLWECRSQLDASVEGEVAAAGTSNPQAPASLKLSSHEEKEQQQRCRVEKEEPADALEDVGAGLAPLSAASCCQEFSGSPFGAPFKGDVSPISCCSSSSTASVTSPTSSPLSSASCGGLPCAAEVTAKAPSAARNEAAAASETAAGAATARTAAAHPPGSADAGEGKRGDANGETEMKAGSSSSTGAARDNNVPTWYVGFRLPLGAEGRQVLLRRLRRAYHAAPPTTRDAVLASHGLYFSRVPFATVSDLFKLSHLLGVFDFAVQCSHEFGGSGASGGSVSAGGGGGSHGSKKSHNHHSRNANKNGNGNRQHCGGGTGTPGEERKSQGSSAEAVGGSTAASPAPHLGTTTATAAAGANQRKSTGGAARRSGGGAAGNCSGARKGGNGKVVEQMSSTESNSTARAASKERGAAGTPVLVEGVEVPPAAGTRDGATGAGDTSPKNDGDELQAALKAATAARNRLPQQKRSAAGRSSACRPAARQQEPEQQQQHNILKEIEALRSVEAAVGRCSPADRSVHSKTPDWEAQQHILQQLLQAGFAEEQAGVTGPGGADGKNTLEAEALALLTAEFGKAAAAAAASALLPSSTEGCNSTKDIQQQQLDEQLLLLQLQEQAKSSAASCRRGGSRAADASFDSRDLRVEQEQQQQQELQCFLSEALQGRARVMQQQQQHQTLGGGKDNVTVGRCGPQRSSRPAALLLQHAEQRQWCSRPSSTAAAGEENTWERQPHEGALKAQLPPTADWLPFLASAAEQLRNSSCLPSVGAAAGRPPYRASRKPDGKALLGAELNDCGGGGSSSSDGGSSFDWNGFLMENYLNTMREQEQQQGETDTMPFSPPGTSTAASTRPSLIRAVPPVAAVATRDRPQSDSRLQDEELLRRTKRPRTTSSRSAATASSVAAALSGHEATATCTPPGVCAALLGRDGVSQAHTQEEEALRTALLAAGGSSLREQQQQQQKRWTLNTMDEITRLLLQLNSGNSSNGAEEESQGGDLMRRGVNHPYAKDGPQYDGSGKHPSSATPCRVPINSTYGSSSMSNGGNSSKGGCSPGLRTDIRNHPPISVNVPSTENASIPASLAGTPIEAAATAQHHGESDVAYDSAFRLERRNVPAHESQDRLNMLPFTHGSLLPAAEQQQFQHESARRPLASSRGLSGGRSSCSSNSADAAAPGGCNKNRAQVDSSSNRDGHTDVFLQLTSQLQLLSAQVLQQQESQPAQQHLSLEHTVLEHQFQNHVQAQQVCVALQKGVNGQSVPTATTPAAQEETTATLPGRLCSADKASEYAAGVQLLQLVELLQVQHRVSRLLSLFPKPPASPPPPSVLTTPVAPASPSPSSLSAAPPTPAGLAAAAAAFSSLDAGGVATTDSAAAVEPSAALLAALASTILDGKTGAALTNNSVHTSDTPASVLLDLASGKVDVASLLKGGGSSESLQQLADMYDLQQQQQQGLPPPNRGPSCRGNNNNNKSNSTKRATNRNNNNKSNATKTNSSKGSNNQGGERKSVAAVTEVVSDQAAVATAPASGPLPAGREKSGSERSAVPPKQQEVVMGNCVSHSNSFSTCCSDDVADLCSSGGSGSCSGIKSSPGSSGNLFDGICNAQPTYDRAYTHESYSCSEARENIVDICMR